MHFLWIFFLIYILFKVLIPFLAMVPVPDPVPVLVPVLVLDQTWSWSLVLVPVRLKFLVPSHSVSESESDTQRAFMFIDHINDGENNTRIRTLEQDILHASCNHNQCH